MYMYRLCEFLCVSLHLAPLLVVGTTLPSSFTPSPQPASQPAAVRHRSLAPSFPHPMELLPSRARRGRSSRRLGLGLTAPTPTLAHPTVAHVQDITTLHLC